MEVKKERSALIDCSVIHKLQVESAAQAVQDLEKTLGLTLVGKVEGTTDVAPHLALPLSSLAKYLQSLLGVQDTGKSKFLACIVCFVYSDI